MSGSSSTSELHLESERVLLRVLFFVGSLQPPNNVEGVVPLGRPAADHRPDDGVFHRHRTHIREAPDVIVWLKDISKHTVELRPGSGGDGGARQGHPYFSQHITAALLLCVAFRSGPGRQQPLLDSLPTP